MSHPVKFRPRGGVIIAAVAITLCAGALVSLFATDGVDGLVRWGGVLVAVAWMAWLAYIQPHVTVTDGFVEIRNLLRTHRVPWGDVDDVTSKYALTITTGSGRQIRAWAAPAPGARRALSTRREEVNRTPGEGPLRRTSDAEGTESGDATALVWNARERYRREGGPALPGGTSTNWNVPSVAITAAVLAAAIWTLAQPVHG